MSSDEKLPLPPEIEEKLKDMSTMTREAQLEYIQDLIQAAHEYNEKIQDDG